MEEKKGYLQICRYVCKRREGGIVAVTSFLLNAALVVQWM